jgi:predicted outer membrane repeat protein
MRKPHMPPHLLPCCCQCICNSIDWQPWCPYVSAVTRAVIRLLGAVIGDMQVLCDNVVLQDNVAEQGGAIATWEDAHLTVAGSCLFSNNTAVQGGGLICLNGSRAYVRCVACEWQPADCAAQSPPPWFTRTRHRETCLMRRTAQSAIIGLPFVCVCVSR